MRIEWTTNSACNTLHSAAWLAAGHAHVDPSIATALGDAVTAAERTLADGGLYGPASQWLDRAASLAGSGVAGAAALSERLLARHVGPNNSSGMQSALTAVLASISSAGERWLSTRPRSLAEEIALRRGPLVEQWESRGPGMLRALARLTQSELIVEASRVSLVLPAAGGHGVPHPPSNSVRIEALLANPHAQLPEIVRLAWLLAQLNADLPTLVEHVPAGRAEELTALAMVPAVLAAAAEVDLVQLNSATIADALTCWHLPTTHAAELQQWWDTYSARRIEWRVAIAALGQMTPSSQ